eukprot:COSAG02_NODE_26593_length_629_cov_1.837736_1_plen_149_part_01
MRACQAAVAGLRRSLVCKGPWLQQRSRAVCADTTASYIYARSTRAYSGPLAAGAHPDDVLLEMDAELGFCSQEQYRSVVKVFNVMSTPNYLMPWQNKPHRDSTGSGFAIDGRRIITNAHVVADSKHCQVRKHGEASKYTASVVGVSHEC